MDNRSHILFSIIIPTYNRATTLPRAINSVLAQIYENFELIIVDDGSTDDTQEVVQNINDARIQYFKKNNEERSIARNFGISHAQGDYICFLDSDDYVFPNHFQTARQLIQSVYQPEFFHLGYQTVNREGEVLYKTNNLPPDVSHLLIKENVLSCNATFIKRDIALKYKFISSREVVISEDWYLWLTLTSRFPIYIDNTITSVIVEHEQRSLRKVDANKLIKSTKIIIDYLNNDPVFLRMYGKRVKYFYANMNTLITLVLAMTKNRRLDTVYYLCKAARWDWKVMGRKRFLASIKHIF